MIFHIEVIKNKIIINLNRTHLSHRCVDVVHGGLDSGVGFDVSDQRGHDLIPILQQALGQLPLYVTGYCVFGGEGFIEGHLNRSESVILDG